jgi:hypothetical protein
VTRDGLADFSAYLLGVFAWIEAAKICLQSEAK